MSVMFLINFFRKRPAQESPPETVASELVESLREGEKLVFFRQVRMHCDGCRMLIEEELGEVRGVLRVDANIKGQTVGVVYEPKDTEPKIINAAIERAGYKPGS